LNLTCRANNLLYDIQQDNHRIQVVYGGAGSGKSYAVAQKVITETLFYPRNSCRYLCVRKVAKSIRHSVFALLKDIIHDMRLEAYFSIKEAEMRIVCINGNDILFSGLDDVEKLKSITGIKKIWVEEASETTEDDLKQLNLRVRGEWKYRKQIMLTFNPIAQTHWLKSYFFDNPKPNAYVNKSTYLDNRFIDDEYRAELEELKTIDHYYYMVYCLGEWGILGNVIFSNFVIEDFETDLRLFDGIYYGMDFGFNHASTYIPMAYKDGEIYIPFEVYVRQRTNTEFVEIVQQTQDDWKISPKEIITADSAEPDRIKDFQQAGINVIGAKKGKDSVRFGIDYLKRHKIHIHRSNAPNTAREFEAYKYKEDKDGNVLDEPVPFDDDCIAGARYGTEALWANPVPKVKVPLKR